jgi:hypothetical protein
MLVKTVFLYVANCKNVFSHSNKFLQIFAVKITGYMYCNVSRQNLEYLAGINVIIWDVVPWPPHTAAPELSDLLSKQKYSNV